MTWSDPPTKITEARDRLLECPAVVALLAGLSALDQQSRFHYPIANALTASLPYIVLNRVSEEYETVTSDGSRGSGEIEAVFFIADEDDSIGEVERLISVAQQLVALRTDGLFVVRAGATLASDTTSAMEAGEDSTADVGRQYRTITVSMGWEG